MVRIKPNTIEATIEGIKDDPKFTEILNNTLNPRQARIIKMLFGIGTRKHSYREVGASYSISGSYVACIFKTKIIKTLKPRLTSAGLM